MASRSVENIEFTIHPKATSGCDQQLPAGGLECFHTRQIGMIDTAYGEAKGKTGV
jgi:hypothetical protein